MKFKFMLQLTIDLNLHCAIYGEIPVRKNMCSGKLYAVSREIRSKD